MNIALKTTACLLLLAGPALAEEMQISGTNYLRPMEMHMLSLPGDPSRAETLEKLAGSSTSSAGTFQETDILTNCVEKMGSGVTKSLWSATNSEGSLFGTGAGTVTWVMDDQTHMAKGTSEGSMEFTGGSGRFANVRGHGTYKGNFADGLIVETWQATVTGWEKQAAAR